MTERTVTLRRQRVIKLHRDVSATITIQTPDPNKPWDPSEPYTYVLTLRSDAENEDEAHRSLVAAENTIRQAFQS